MIKNKLNIDSHTLEVVKKSSNSLIIKICGIAVLFAISVFLGRTLGADRLGVINLADKIIVVLLIFSLLGVPQLLIKDIAIAYEKKDWKFVSNVVNSALLLNGFVTLIIGFLLFVFIPYLCNNLFNESQLVLPLMILLTATFAQVYTRIISSGLVGFKKIWQSNLINETLSLFVLGSVLLILFLFNFDISIVTVAWAYVIGRFIAAIIGAIYWKKVFSLQKKKASLAPYLFNTALPFLTINATAIIASNTDAIMLGWLSDTRDVGLYTVTAKIALLTSFILQVANTALSPKIASMFNDGKIKEINKMVQKITLGLIVLGGISMIFFIVFGENILSLWGEEFTEAYMLLIILSLGQFFNIGTGSAGYVLIMCGHEKIQSKIAITFVFINIILNFFLIKEYGILGAGIATAITVSLENITKVIFAKRKTNINTIPFDLIFRR